MTREIRFNDFIKTRIDRSDNGSFIMEIDDYREDLNCAAQYFPTFVTGYPIRIKSFITIDDLINIEWIGKWSRLDGFSKFSVVSYGDEFHLMAEFNNNVDYYCVAYIFDGNIGLPEWKRPARKR